MLLCDTGVLLAAGNVKDHHHHACLRLLRQADGPLLVPSPVMGEIGYLLESRVGPQAEVSFLKSFSGDGFHIAQLENEDIPRLSTTRSPRCTQSAWRYRRSGPLYSWPATERKHSGPLAHFRLRAQRAACPDGRPI